MRRRRRLRRRRSRTIGNSNSGSFWWKRLCWSGMRRFPRPIEPSARPSWRQWSIPYYSSRGMRNPKFGFVARLWQGITMRHCLPCVGLVVFLGCFALVVTPDEDLPHPKPWAFRSHTDLPTIIIDPGHGGKDDGASAHGLKEKDLTLDIALRVEQMLQTTGFPTILTRRSDRFVSLPDRVELANKQDHAIFVSIHFNQS